MVEIVRGNCPTCGLADLHHSHLRSFGERLRFNFSRKVLLRCHSCGWRGWCEDVSTSSENDLLISNPVTEDHDKREQEKRRA